MTRSRRSRSIFSHAFLAGRALNLQCRKRQPTRRLFVILPHHRKQPNPFLTKHYTPSFSRTYLARNIIDTSSTIVNSLNYLSNRNLSFPHLDPMAPVPRPNRHLNFSKWLQTHANYLFAQPPTQALVRVFTQVPNWDRSLCSDKKGEFPVFPRKNLIAYESLGRRLLF